MGPIIVTEKNSLLLSMYRGRKINREVFSKYFFPNGTSETEFIHEIVGQYDIVAYELYAFISGDAVDYVDAFKIQDVPVGHGQPRSIEKNLSAAEWKYAYQVFDECFPDQSGDEVQRVIENAFEKKCAYAGYKIDKILKNDITFISPAGTTVKVSKNRIAQAICYSHKDLSILRNPAAAEAFARAFDKKPYEPL